MIGKRIGNFEIVSRLGKGGMGEVWLAEQANIRTRVAIKTLHPEISAQEQHVKRLFNEAVAVGQIKHSGIVKIFDVGFHEDQAYLVMEYLDGESLAKRIGRLGGLPTGRLLEIGRQIASVLVATHAAGITHRDLKPENIYLVPDADLVDNERVKVLDFGIAKVVGAGLTGTNVAAMGTPRYMSPEQWTNAGAVDHKTDAYALGCILFEMACGRPPFELESIGEAYSKHMFEVPQRVRTLAPHVPAAVDELIARLLAKRPADRPELAEAMAIVTEVGRGTIAESSPRPPERPSEVTPRSVSTTTLSSGIGSMASMKRRERRGLWIALGAVTVVGGVAVTIVALGGSEPPTGSAATTTSPAVQDAAPIAPDALAVSEVPAPPESPRSLLREPTHASSAFSPANPRQLDTKKPEPPTVVATTTGSREEDPGPGSGSSRPTIAEPFSDSETPTVPTLPKQLDGKLVAEGLALVNGRLVGCAGVSGVVKLRFVVEPAGNVATAYKLEATNDGLARCVVNVIEKARFVATEQKTIVERWLELGEGAVRVYERDPHAKPAAVKNGIGTLVITASFEAEISVDGKLTGRKTPAELELRAGDHKILLANKARGLVKTHFVNVEAGKTTKIDEPFAP